MREIFSVKIDFSGETFDLMGELGENTNCVLSNLRLSDRRESPAPAEPGSAPPGPSYPSFIQRSERTRRSPFRQNNVF